MIEVTNENYYTDEVNKQYMSVSLFKELNGTLGHRACEARAMAMLNGDYAEENKKAFLVGGYVDAYFEGTLAEYCEANMDEIFTASSVKAWQKDHTKELSKYADFKQADLMIERCLKDELFMKFMSGEKQVIMTATLFDVPWKIKIDSYLPGKAIVDLKTCQDMTKVFYAPDYGHCNFIEYYGYYTQLAVYQRVVEINTGYKLPCYIAAVNKSDHPKIDVIQLEQSRLDEALTAVQNDLPYIYSVWKGDCEPTRCECCDYCYDTAVLKKPIWASELLGDVAQ